MGLGSPTGVSSLGTLAVSLSGEGSGELKTSRENRDRSPADGLVFGTAALSLEIAKVKVGPSIPFHHNNS